MNDQVTPIITGPRNGEQAILPPFGGILPPFCHPIGFESGRVQPLSGTQGKRVATFALVTTVGPEPRPARSTPGELGRAADRQAFASFSYPINRQVLRNPHIGRPGFLVSTSIHPRTAVRRGRHAGLLLTTVLPKTLHTIPTYIVYDNVTQCFGHEPLSGAMRLFGKTEQSAPLVTHGRGRPLSATTETRDAPTSPSLPTQWRAPPRRLLGRTEFIPLFR